MIRRTRPFVRPPPRRTPREPIVPMINVVFLLLIFFLMTAQLTPPDPFPLTLPEAASDPADAAPALSVSRGGDVAFGTLRGDAALAAAATHAPAVLVQADTGLEAAELARILARLTALGTTRISLATRPGARQERR